MNASKTCCALWLFLAGGLVFPSTLTAQRHSAPATVRGHLQRSDAFMARRIFEGPSSATNVPCDSTENSFRLTSKGECASMSYGSLTRRSLILIGP